MVLLSLAHRPSSQFVSMCELLRLLRVESRGRESRNTARLYFDCALSVLVQDDREQRARISVNDCNYSQDTCNTRASEMF